MDKSGLKQQSMPQIGRGPKAAMGSHLPQAIAGGGQPGRKDALQGAGLKQMMIQKKGNRNLNSVLGYGKKRHKTPLSNVHRSAHQYGSQRAAGFLGARGPGATLKSNQDLYDPTREFRFTDQQIQEQLLPVQRETGSRVFGDNLEDYQELAKRLGDFRLSRIRANELNIYARGSVTGVRAHLNLLRSSANAFGQEGHSDLSLIDCLTGQGGHAQGGGTGEGEGSSQALPRRPPLDPERVADWFNQNAHLIKAKNYLRSDVKELGGQFFGGRAFHANSTYSNTQYGSQFGGFTQQDAGSRLQGEGRWASQMQHYGLTQDNRSRNPDPYLGPAASAQPRGQRYSQESLSGQEAQNVNQSSYFKGPQESCHSQLAARRYDQSRRFDRLPPAPILEKMDLENNIHKTLNIMKKDKKVLSQVQSTLSLYQQDRIKKSFEDGLRATGIAQKRVRDHRQRRSDEEEAGIEDLIKQQTDAIHATNLERLLTKKWSEHPNSYHIMTKIGKFSKREDRVNKLLNLNRYSP